MGGQDKANALAFDHGMTAFGVPGQEHSPASPLASAQIRPLWRHYFANTQGLVFVVDSADRERIAEAKEELHHMLGEVRWQSSDPCRSESSGTFYCIGLSAWQSLTSKFEVLDVRCHCICRQPMSCEQISAPLAVVRSVRPRAFPDLLQHWSAGVATSGKSCALCAFVTASTCK